MYYSHVVYISCMWHHCLLILNSHWNSQWQNRSSPGCTMSRPEATFELTVTKSVSFRTAQLTQFGEMCTLLLDDFEVEYLGRKSKWATLRPGKREISMSAVWISKMNLWKWKLIVHWSLKDFSFHDLFGHAQHSRSELFIWRQMSCCFRLQNEVLFNRS